MIEVSDIVLGWAGIGHWEIFIPDWLTRFGRDPRPQSVMYEGKLLIPSGIIYYTWRSRNVKIVKEVVWLAVVCAKMIIDL